MPLINECRICSSKNLVSIIDLGEQPWCNNFITKTERRLGIPKYPLELMLCKDCTLPQLSFNVPKEVMFKNHTYVSGTTKTLSYHFKKIAEYTIKKFKIKPDDLILDIGGNDGTNLLQYRALGCNNLINVESAENIAEMSRKNKINTINEYFNYSLSFQLKEQVKLVSAAGVFFHLEDLHNVCRGIKEILIPKKGIFAVQCMYMGEILKNLSFDSIYHEHLLYYTKKSLIQLMEMYDLYPLECIESEIHGGSLIFYFTNDKKKANKIDLIDNFSLKDYKKFAKKIVKYKEDINELFESIKKKTIHCYGAPAKGNTLLNYTGIGKYIKLVEEANPLKCGLYTPGSNLPIVHFSEVKIKPDYYLVLSWNFLEEFLIKEEEYLQKGGKFIIPFPNKPFIIDKNNYKKYL
jgi:hypothetical protein